VPGAEGDGLDFWSLQQRIHPAASRVNMLAEKTPACFIAFDLLALGDDDHTGAPFVERRALLEQALAAAAPPVYVTPITRSETLARQWFDLFEGAGVDGLIAKHGQEPYQPGKRVMRKIKHERTADCVVAGYRPHKSIPDAIGSLLLGLHDDGASPAPLWDGVDGGLVPVGVIGAFPRVRRVELFQELQPLVTGFAGHPWQWAADMAAAATRSGQGSRWNPTKSLSFVPLRPERVVEVRYDYLEGARFRHPVQFVRWRPDRDPGSCGFAQLEQPVRFDLARVLAGEVT
jgi:ATP-dependent DNA ligase